MKKKYFYRFIKRTFDILCSIIGIILLLPITIIVKLAYVLTGDFKSILYSQDRIGKDGKIIPLFKYRSMVWNADEKLEELLKDKKLKKEYDKYKKLENDPRITKVGKVLRRLSLDEFPQFINVFLGHMSLIGPRPYLPGERKDMGKYYDVIIKAKPGITGLWQVNGRSETTFEERLVMEEEYVQKCGLLFDIRIFFKTFWAVFARKGAK